MSCCPNDTPQGRISLRLLVAAGSLMETEDQRGLAHFLEHMAFKGSQNLPAGDLVQYLERLGMAFGADTNARTSFESTVFQLELPANDPELVDKSLIGDARNRGPAADPRLRAGQGARRDPQREAPARRSGLSELLPKTSSSSLPGTLVPQRSPIGVASVIETAPRQRLVDFYRTWYRPERITLVVVGGHRPGQFAGHIKEHFDSLRAAMPEPAQPRARYYRPPWSLRAPPQRSGCADACKPGDRGRPRPARRYPGEPRAGSQSVSRQRRARAGWRP